MFRPCILQYDVPIITILVDGYIDADENYVPPIYENTFKHSTYPCKSQTDFDWAMAHIKSSYGVTPTIEYNMTEAEYVLEQSIKKGTNPKQLRADLDYIMLMEGL